MSTLQTAAEQRKQLRRQLLIDTAMSLFSSRGYHNTTVPMIVEASKTSTGSFYQHFRSKEDVLYAAILDFGIRLETSMNELQTTVSNPQICMKMMIEQLFMHLLQDPIGTHLLLIETSGLSARIHQARIGILQTHIRKMHQKLAENIPNLPEAKLWIASHCILGSIFQICCARFDASQDDLTPASEVAQCTSDFLLRAVVSMN